MIYVFFRHILEEQFKARLSVCARREEVHGIFTLKWTYEIIAMLGNIITIPCTQEVN